MSTAVNTTASGPRPRATPLDHGMAIARVVGAYHEPLVRAYSWARFKIFRQRFLEEIGQYLPERGRVLDIGSGFGLFALYYASRSPARTVVGMDLSSRRVATARRAAAELGLSNAQFDVGDARTMGQLEPFDAVYVLDVLHHIPRDVVPQVIREVHAALPAGGVFVVKDLDTQPAWQRVFAHVLDVAMSPSSPPHYWSQDDMTVELTRAGFTVKRHVLIDYLPYPHVLFVATKTG